MPSLDLVGVTFHRGSLDLHNGDTKHNIDTFMKQANNLIVHTLFEIEVSSLQELDHTCIYDTLNNLILCLPTIPLN